MASVIAKLKKKKVLLIIGIILLLLAGFFIKNRVRRFFDYEYNTGSIGVITGFKANNRDDIDGIIVLANNKSVFELGFPPHLAYRVISTAKIGDKVSVFFNTRQIHRNDKDKRIDYRLLVISNLKTHKSEDISIENRPAFEKGLDVITVIKDYKIHIDDHDNPDGIIANNDFIDIKPHLLKQIAPMLNQAKSISVKGKKRDENSGFINYYGYSVIKPDSITLDNSTYLLR